MKYTLIAQDLAPSQAFVLLAAALRNQGHTVTEFLASGNQIPGTSEDRARAVEESDALIVGMSSSPARSEPEVAAVTLAQGIGRKVFCYADSFGLRPWFHELLANDGTTLFHISESEAAKARVLVPTAHVVVTGNPMWEKFFYPSLTWTQVRDKLGFGNECLILVPGGKSEEVNLLHFERAIEIATATDAIALISIHPNDITDVANYRRLIGNTRTQIILGSVLSGPQLVAGMDAVIESASTIGIEAACQGIPVYDWFSAPARQRLEASTGRAIWPLCEIGVAYLLGDDFRGDLRDIDYGPCAAKAREICVPPVNPGQAIERMITQIVK